MGLVSLMSPGCDGGSGGSYGSSGSCGFCRPGGLDESALLCGSGWSVVPRWANSGYFLAI